MAIVRVWQGKKTTVPLILKKMIHFNRSYANSDLSLFLDRTVLGIRYKIRFFACNNHDL